MSLRDEMPEDELAVTSKALDVHRQALIRKLNERKLNDNEKQRTMDEIESCSKAATRFREQHDAMLREKRVAS
jgi:hypothetical protein